MPSDEGQTQVERRVVKEFARADENDGEFDASFECRAFAIDDLADQLPVMLTFFFLSRFDIYGTSSRRWRLVQPEDENKDGRDELAVFSDPYRGDDPIRVQR